MKYKKEQQLMVEAYGQIHEANTQFKPVTSTYIYFDNEGELYQRDPYKLIGDTAMVNKLQKQGIKWGNARIATSGDIQELIPGAYNQISDERVWYQVDDSFPRDHSYSVLLSNK